MQYTGPERRKYPRVTHPFLVYYYPIEKSDSLDLTQVKNISLGGLFFTTSRAFAKGESLGLRIRLPGSKEPVPSIATVISSQQPIPRARFYDTRVQFSSISESVRQTMSEALSNYLKT